MNEVPRQPIHLPHPFSYGWSEHTFKDSILNYYKVYPLNYSLKNIWILTNPFWSGMTLKLDAPSFDF